MSIEVTVTNVDIPRMSTIGYGIGNAVVHGRPCVIQFVGDHRPMRDIGMAIADGVEVTVEVEQWQIIEQQEVDQ